jgi:hypothetical protein
MGRLPHGSGSTPRLPTRPGADKWGRGRSWLRVTQEAEDYIRSPGILVGSEKWPFANVRPVRPASVVWRP